MLSWQHCMWHKGKMYLGERKRMLLLTRVPVLLIRGGL